MYLGIQVYLAYTYVPFGTWYLAFLLQLQIWYCAFHKKELSVHLFWFLFDIMADPGLLFGMEKEPPNDLINIFYRSVRYSIFFQRKRSLIPRLKYFVNLVRDELKIKYGGIRFQRYAGCPTEAAAILWMKREMGWTQTIPERMPT